MNSRRCSRATCSEPAVATLTYVYADSTAVLGPLALRAEPGIYDLCLTHAESLRAPKGWEVIRLSGETPGGTSRDDLMELADAVRRVGLADELVPEVPLARRKGHLGVVADPSGPRLAT